MNQILSINVPKTKKNKSNKFNNPTDTKKILKVFAFLILIFGIGLVATGAYAFFSDQEKIKTENLVPTFSIETKSKNTIMVKITSPVNIARLEYYWGDGESTTVNGQNGQYLEKEIEIPSGTNTLHLIVKDVNGKESTYDKQYTLESDIKISVVENKINITYSGDKELSYLTYRWDENPETQINLSGKTVSEQIDAIKGLHELTVSIVDKDNHTESTTKKIKGVSKPKITINCDDTVTHFTINASDDVQLSKIRFTLDYDKENIYELDISDMNTKEYELTLPDSLKLHTGSNVIEVTVYNVDGVTETAGARVTK